MVAEGRKNGGKGDWGKLQGRKELSIMGWKVKKYLKDLFFFILKELIVRETFKIEDKM